MTADGLADLLEPFAGQRLHTGADNSRLVDLALTWVLADMGDYSAYVRIYEAIAAACNAGLMKPSLPVPLTRSGRRALAERFLAAYAARMLQ